GSRDGEHSSRQPHPSGPRGTARSPGSEPPRLVSGGDRSNGRQRSPGPREVGRTTPRLSAGSLQTCEPVQWAIKYPYTRTSVPTPAVLNPIFSITSALRHTAAPESATAPVS